jgi:peptidyl-prolyl cis-trans isomerase SurA
MRFLFRVFGPSLVLFWATLQPSLAQQERQEVMDGIAAVVNGDVITISQLRELTGAREMALRDALRGDELVSEIKRMRESALRDLIDRQLVIQEFKKREFSIPPYLVDDRVQSIIRQEFGGDRSAFVRTLQAQGYSLTRFKEIEKEKIIVQAMRQSNVKENFITTPRQIQAFYDRNKHAYTSPEELKLRMIVVREGGLPAIETTDDIPSAGDKKALAQEIRQKLVEGADFERMAAMYSEDPSTADIGGDWGWIQRNTLNEKLTGVAFSLGAGQISPVVQIGDSYYILYVEDRKPARTRPLAEVKDEIERNLMQEERQKAAERWLETLRKAAFIKILV